MQETSLETILDEEETRPDSENDESVLEEYLISDAAGAGSSDDDDVDKQQLSQQKSIRIDASTLDFGSVRCESIQEKLIQVSRVSQHQSLSFIEILSVYQV